MTPDIINRALDCLLNLRVRKQFTSLKLAISVPFFYRLSIIVGTTGSRKIGSTVALFFSQSESRSERTFFGLFWEVTFWREAPFCSPVGSVIN